jgi:hypothetical protein
VLHHPCRPAAPPSIRHPGGDGVRACTRAGRLLLHPLQGTLLHPRGALSSTRRPLSCPPAGRLLLPPPPRRPPSTSSSSRYSRLLLPLPNTSSSPAGRLVLPHRLSGPLWSGGTSSPRHQIRPPTTFICPQQA